MVRKDVRRDNAIRTKWLSLYRLMVKSRLFEEATISLWNDGEIAGEMHMGIGEEAIVAGVVACLEPGDAIASDHRGTPPFIMNGVDPALILLELLGDPRGLCKGWGGHMHLFCREKLMASSGIVGSPGPAAAGFALAASKLRKGTISVAFFGEGAMNQGMMMESMNLAAVWKLPVLFVCKDNDWAISTRSSEVTGGDLLTRARGLGLEAVEVDGTDVIAVHDVVRPLVEAMRKKPRPCFVRARCAHREGHFLGDLFFKVGKDTLGNLGEFKETMKAVVKAKGARLDKRIASLGKVMGLLRAVKGQEKKGMDPLLVFRKKSGIDDATLDAVEDEIAREIGGVVDSVISTFKAGTSDGGVAR